MNKQPERTAQTRRLIIDAFWAISRTTEKVTVSAVAKKAGINRGTFYMYFEDVNHLVNSVEEDMINDLQTKIKSAVTSGFKDIHSVTKKFVEAFTFYDDKLFILLKRNGSSDFVKKVQKNAAVMFKELFNSDTASPYAEYVIAYSSSAFIGLITYWHTTGRKISLDKLATLMHDIITKGVFTVAFDSNE